MTDDAVLSIYTIYLDPVDLGPGYAMREWRTYSGRIEPGPAVGGLKTLEAARDFVPPWADQLIPRNPGDDPTIVETWI